MGKPRRLLLQKASRAIASFVLSCSLAIGMVPVVAYADEGVQPQGSEPPSQLMVEPASPGISGEEPENTASSDDFSQNDEDVLQQGGVEDADSAELPEVRLLSDEGAASEAVGFVYIDQKDVSVGNAQYIAIGVAEEYANDGMILVYEGPDGSLLRSKVKNHIEDALLFEISFDSPEEIGSYRLIRLESDGNELSPIELVGEDGSLNFAVIPAEESLLDVSVATINEDGTLDAADSIEAALDENPDDGIAPFAMARQGDTIVCALDPGHGGSDPGAVNGSLLEKDLNLKIANYCKDALYEYRNIRVVMTRTTDEFVGLTERVERAASMGATLFVSIHINAGGASGFEVWIQNDSWKNELHNEGEGLARDILDKLSRLNLPDRGIKTRNTQYDRYPDGSIADYLTVLNESKVRDIPAILVEHGFIDSSDSDLLRQDWFLQQLGQADADGIVDYYGLVKGWWEQTPSGQWKYIYSDGTYAVDQWLEIKGYWYHFDRNGIMQTGWLKDGGNKFYLDPSGAMATGWRWIDGTYYYFAGGGALRTGWLYENGTYFYLDPSEDTAAEPNKKGSMFTGEHKIGKDTFCFASGGAMLTGWHRFDAGWRHFAGGGAMHKGWVDIDGARHCFDQNGYALTGKQVIDGKTYYFDERGKPSTGLIKDGPNTVFVNEDGSLAKGWKYVGAACYYFNGNGHMQTGWLKDGGNKFYLDPSGAMATGWRWIDGTYYYFAGGGALRTGWLYENGTYFYLDPSEDTAAEPNKKGSMFTGLHQIGKDTFCFASGGAMVTGWHWIGDKCYYFAGGGAMVKDAWVDIYYVDKNGVWDPSLTGVPIMGTPTVSVQDMVRAYQQNSRIAYPSGALSQGGAPTIEAFCTQLYNAAVSEGVRPEVVFVQSMKETGWLKFGGDVKIEQYNFAGIGATGNGVPGNSFRDVHTGLLAQVQHLKAYATDSSVPLNNDPVDPRFSYVKRGCAPIVQWLGIKENPSGAGWAAAPGYGYDLVNLMMQCFGHH